VQFLIKPILPIDFSYSYGELLNAVSISQKRDERIQRETKNHSTDRQLGELKVKMARFAHSWTEWQDWDKLKINIK